LRQPRNLAIIIEAMMPVDAVDLLLNHITESLPVDRAALRRLKRQVAARTSQPLVRNDRLLRRYRDEVASGARQADSRIERILTLNQIRSESGVATVTVITEPYACPGRCVYCPTEARAPKSYLTNEPAVMRALRNDYDPFRQVASRLAALAETGHPTDKIELIIKGGTWSFYPAAYQELFIRRCLDAANSFPDAGDASAPTLQAAEARNETSPSRIIGITIETRPDHVTEAEVLRLRELGVTRVELGVQTLEEPILKLIVRDHGTHEVRKATQRLKDAGFKVAYHLMPNLPGATPASDLASAQQLFDDAGYRPDAMKLYPCVVIETAELYRWWQEGAYQPYDDETLISLLVAIKQHVPPYVRIERVIRDIPSTSIRAGCLATNLRQAVQQRMEALGLRCRCIRCRQVRFDAGGESSLTRHTYEASGGTEIFLSFEDAASDRLASLLRLRIPGTMPVPCAALRGAALIRELHSYGQHLPISAHASNTVQHIGFGRRLLAEAERLVAHEYACARIAVIAGVGVREYYRKLGYRLEQTYMVKDL
jgi:elongator complex protein 3